MRNYDIDINTITSKLDTRIIVFEGPDCSGKTTLLNTLSNSLSAMNGGLYNFIDTFKFPQYFSDIGPYILEYLKKGPDRIIKDHANFSKLQTINKIAGIGRFINTVKNVECVFCDRFVISQLAYDIALLRYAKLKRTKTNKKDVLDRINNANYVQDIYSKIIDRLITVYCTPSEYIKGVSNYFRNKLRKEGRRFDAVDDNAEYQTIVKDTFSDFFNKKKEFYNIDVGKYAGIVYELKTDDIIKQIYTKKNRLNVYEDIIRGDFDSMSIHEGIIQDVKKEYAIVVKNELIEFILKCNEKE